MKIHSVLVISRRIDEIVGKAGRRRKLISSLRIEIGVSPAGINGPMSNTEIGQASGVIGTHGNVTREVGHPVVHPRVPAHGKWWKQISKCISGVADVEGPREWN